MFEVLIQQATISLIFKQITIDTFMIGKTHKGAIVTLDERISKLRLAYPLNSKHKNGVSAAINTLLQPVKNFVHSITSIYQ
jgi:IS30 family transposase